MFDTNIFNTKNYLVHAIGFFSSEYNSFDVLFNFANCNLQLMWYWRRLVKDWTSRLLKLDSKLKTWLKHSNNIY